jgi:hypothetical protein
MAETPTLVGDRFAKGACMLGIDDPIVLLAYLLCIGSSLLCVVYGILCWNKGHDAVTAVDVKWATEEKRAENEL